MIDNEEIEIFRKYLQIPSVYPDVDYGMATIKIVKIKFGILLTGFINYFWITAFVCV